MGVYHPKNTLSWGTIIYWSGNLAFTSSKFMNAGGTGGLKEQQTGVTKKAHDEGKLEHESKIVT